MPFGGGTTRLRPVLLIAAEAVARARASGVAGARPANGRGIGLLNSDVDDCCGWGGGMGAWKAVITDVGVGTIHSSEGEAGLESSGVREKGVRLPMSTSESCSSSSSNQSDCLGEGIDARTALAAVGVTMPDCGRSSKTTTSSLLDREGAGEDGLLVLPGVGVGGSGDVGGGFRGDGKPVP